MNQLKEGALYIRVSTHMQDELSPDAQKRLILDYARNNHIIISNEHIYEDSGISGRKAEKRPAFLKMISDAKSKEHPFDVILVWKFSRFARNQEESIVYKSLLTKQCNVEVVSVTEPLVDGPFGSLIERIIEWMDEYYSIRLSGEVTRGMTEKALRGGYQARPPLGYKILERKKPPVIVPEEAKIVKYIFEQYVNNGKSFFNIARELNCLGYKTSRGRDFECRSVEYILQNPTYCGMIRWNRKENETNIIKDPSEWIITEGSHEPIISKKTFELAQERFKKEQTPARTRPAATYKHWLSGMLKCPACGRTMVSSKVNKYSYFVCYGYAKGKCSIKNTISQPKIVAAVLESLKITLHSGIISYQYVEPESDSDLFGLPVLQDQLRKLDAKEMRIKEAYRNGIDTLQEYKENKEILTRERDSIINEIEKVKSMSGKSDMDHSPELLLRVQNVYDILISDADTETKSNALRSVVEKIVYSRKDDLIKVYYYYRP